MGVPLNVIRVIACNCTTALVVSAAGFLIVEEAGGKVTDFKGNYYSPYQPHLVATNGKIHDELLDVINNRKQL